MTFSVGAVPGSGSLVMGTVLITETSSGITVGTFPMVMMAETAAASGSTTAFMTPVQTAILRRSVRSVAY